MNKELADKLLAEIALLRRDMKDFVIQGKTLYAYNYEKEQKLSRAVDLFGDEDLEVVHVELRRKEKKK